MGGDLNSQPQFKVFTFQKSNFRYCSHFSTLNNIWMGRDLNSQPQFKVFYIPKVNHRHLFRHANIETICIKCDRDLNAAKHLNILDGKVR